MPNRLAALLESVGRPRILVVGDLILDTYVRGNAERVSPEGPIPVLRVTAEESRPGGAGNVIAALAHLGARVTPCGVVGDDQNGRLLAQQLAPLAADTAGIITAPDRPTTAKTRYIGYVQSAHRGIQHMLRVDRESTAPISPDTEKQILRHLEQTLPRQNAVVLSDYDKGLLTPPVIRRAIELAADHGIPVIADPKIGRSYEIYRGVTVLTPNRYETQLATGIAPGDKDTARAAADKIRELAAPRHVVITLDRDGIYLDEQNQPGILIPTQPREIFDVTGAGDIVVSLLALLLAHPAPIRDAVALANVAAGIEVSKSGAAPVSRAEIIAEILGGDGVHRKLQSLDQAVALAEETRRRNGKVVWTNGCFDLFHVGHYEYLRFARKQGDLLIVGLNSDASVRRLKGPQRPITGESERTRLLAALDVVDALVVFDQDSPADLIRAIRPDVIVKGADYKHNEVVGHDLVAAWGGTVALAPIVQGISTTDLVNRILKLHGNSQ